MRTYATAWVNPKRKLSTSVDTQGHNHPTWNDKFVFRVDEEFLRTDTSAVMIEIYGVHWFRDTLIGRSVRVLVGNLVPPPTRPHNHNHNHFGMRFVALQVRRPSGRPQGILNIGVAVLDSSMRSMPLYTQLSASAVGYRDLMDEDYLNGHGHHGPTNPTTTSNNVKPILRRSKSERSERVTFDDDLGSIVGVPQKKGASSSLAHSFWSDSEVGPSPSDVAAVMARERYLIDDNQSSVLDGWSLDESVEGLRSKLDRWRMELPPLYDRAGFGGSSYRSTSQHPRRHSDDGGPGLFSCFGNIYGYECQCICGKPPGGRRSLSSRFQSPSASAGRSFI
ncbi:calcium-dependent lipid-binding (CaLB domain) family protein [Actinidia rufa]|uniref:Calcium-dependent lipid-binding (CaLB domain) family protein n=1 Tax=Actinidia rufa TaxID=165716 RepID=A0A7J0F329_9ERIC|nr:calcium-dependent lipid-binding (CaLB domain) family protein [Actinidia rufa]